MLKEILSDGTKNPLPSIDKIFGFNGKESCSIGKLSLIVRSTVDPKYDLAYIDFPDGSFIIGLLSDLKPHSV